MPLPLPCLTLQQRALTPSVLACLSKSRSLWVEWTKHVREAALFAAHVARKCRDDAKLSCLILTSLVANLDEKGYQKNNGVGRYVRLE